MAIGGALGYGVSGYRRRAGGAPGANKDARRGAGQRVSDDTDLAARRLYQGAALLSFSVLADSGLADPERPKLLEKRATHLAKRLLLNVPPSAACAAAVLIGGFALAKSIRRR